MLFTIFCIDKPNVAEKRAAAMPGHVEYLNAQTKMVKQFLSRKLRQI